MAYAGLGSTAAVLWLVLVPVQTALYGTPLPLAVVLVSALCAAPLLVISHRRTGTVLFCVAALLLPFTVDSLQARPWPWPWSVPAMIALVLFVGVLTFVHGWRPGLIAMGVSVIGSVLAPVLVPDAGTAGSTLADLIVTAALAPVALLVAMLASSRVRVAAELSQERELSATEHSRRLLVEERTRIARELHDVVAHSMSVVQVQAATARYRLPDLDDGVAAEFDGIAGTAREALLEMRRLLGVLRTEDHVAPLSPQSELADIPELVETFRRAGAEVALAPIDARSAAAPTAVQIAAFRIVQEAISNAVRHAPGAAISVSVSSRGDRTRVRVVNPLSAAAPLDDHGHGLRGMQERVNLLEGTLHAGPDGEGRWAVDAHLPWKTIEVDEGNP
ncbi:sensor histidine kinase [Microbacterium sp. NIBRBAC000506063]|uniref:sensor histidine kinase n=1 Tax=Microbacterium sp. NIBRBAC000506063 TaxID=2734618 RepID=UPI001CB751E4|nr:histidine kinase [Microbacterium sp. NIBRBAC000506063]